MDLFFQICCSCKSENLSSLWIFIIILFFSRYIFFLDIRCSCKSENLSSLWIHAHVFYCIFTPSQVKGHKICLNVTSNYAAVATTKIKSQIYKPCDVMALASQMCTHLIQQNELRGGRERAESTDSNFITEHARCHLFVDMIIYINNAYYQNILPVTLSLKTQQFIAIDAVLLNAKTTDCLYQSYQVNSNNT